MPQSREDQKKRFALKESQSSREQLYSSDEIEVGLAFSSEPSANSKSEKSPLTSPRTIISDANNYDSNNSDSNNYGELQPLLDDPSIEEIWINSPQRVFIARFGRSELTNLVLTSHQVQSIMDRILLWSGRRIDLAQPFVDARLPDGSRLHITIPEITAEHWAINIRKHLLRGKSLHDLVELDVMDVEVASYLIGAVKNRKNFLVSGSTQAGKTTLTQRIGEFNSRNRTSHYD